MQVPISTFSWKKQQKTTNYTVTKSLGNMTCSPIFSPKISARSSKSKSEESDRSIDDIEKKIDGNKKPWSGFEIEKVRLEKANKVLKIYDVDGDAGVDWQENAAKKTNRLNKSADTEIDMSSENELEVKNIALI